MTRTAYRIGRGDGMDASIYIREELRPAIVEFKRPVCDEDGYQMYQEVVHRPANVHTTRLAP